MWLSEFVADFTLRISAQTDVDNSKLYTFGFAVVFVNHIDNVMLQIHPGIIVKLRKVDMFEEFWNVEHLNMRKKFS